MDFISNGINATVYAARIDIAYWEGELISNWTW